MSNTVSNAYRSRSGFDVRHAIARFLVIAPRGLLRKKKEKERAEKGKPGHRKGGKPKGKVISGDSEIEERTEREGAGEERAHAVRPRDAWHGSVTFIFIGPSMRFVALVSGREKRKQRGSVAGKKAERERER